MTDADEYLWNRGGSPDPRLADIERELSTLAWQPRPLALTPAIEAHTSVPKIARRSLDHARPSGWGVGLIAGLAMAATVLTAVYIARHDSDVDVDTPKQQPRVESIEPAGQPQRSPELNDPFSRTRREGHSNPAVQRTIRELPREQTPTPPTQSDLNDPFARNPGRPSNHSATRPDTRSSDLKDPFSRDQSSPSQSGTLVDPFGDERQPSKDSGADLKDPFAKPR